MHSLKCANTAKFSLPSKWFSGAGCFPPMVTFAVGIKVENDMVIAIHTDYFLGYIRIIFHILAVCREMQGQLITLDLRIKIKTFQDEEYLHPEQ